MTTEPAPDTILDSDIVIGLFWLSVLTNLDQFDRPYWYTWQRFTDETRCIWQSPKTRSIGDAGGTSEGRR